MTNQSLHAIRCDAFKEDLTDPALTPYPLHIRKRGGYTPADYRARTLDQLSKWAGQYGEAAIAEARWSALATWLMHGPTPGQLSHPADVVYLSIDLCREADRESLGYPIANRTVRPARLDALSLKSQDEARRTAQDTLDDWEWAGSPHLTSNIQWVQMYVNAFGRTPRVPSQGGEA